jgi:predicted Zn-dependent peptidase
MKSNPPCTRGSTGVMLMAAVLWGLLMSAGQPLDAHAAKVSHRLFDVRSSVLDNGLHVIEQPQTGSDTVIMQLVVDVGLRDFPCEKQQIPHVVEHVLFELNTRYTPEELRRKTRDLGGNSNGLTTAETTLYTLSIHSDHAMQIVETLLTMIRDIRWDPHELQRVLRIVDTEIETPLSPIQRWYDSKPALYDMAKAQLYPGTPLDCDTRSAAWHLDLASVKQAFDSYYRADNMTLIIIGQLHDDAKKSLLEGLATLPSGGLKSRFEVPATIITTPVVQKAGFGSSSAWVYLLTRSPGRADPDFFAADVLAEYLNERLFAEIRLKYGLGYTPRAYIEAEARQGVMFAFTKTLSDQVDTTSERFRHIYAQVREEGIPEPELQRIKRKKILKFEAEERTAIDIAELYRLFRTQIRSEAGMPRVTDAYASVTREDIRRVTGRFLPETPVNAVLRPPTQAEASITVTVIILIAAFLAWPLNRWLQRRNREEERPPA